ncbi:Ccc1 family protein [Tribonema minus]|uniref:Ccc1 family protein n=1 Tax=Tribonema minus TaxID=303371 RepID=A0A835YXT4_9STRA|nr:Ccc1 family protein [Tribonema minus]
MEHEHFSNRSPWLRAAVLGANDGLVSVATLLMGVGGGGAAKTQVLLAGIAGLVGGMCSMALGEYVSVASQKDAELADIEKEKKAQALGPASREKELEELTEIYVDRGLTKELARQVAQQLSEHDVIRAHARDELGIDMDELANPLQAALTSAVSFATGAALPLATAAFYDHPHHRLEAIAGVCVAGLIVCGAIGSHLGGSSMVKGAARVCSGGILALATTFGAGYLFGTDAAA